MKVYGSNAIRNVAFVGHGGERQDVAGRRARLRVRLQPAPRHASRTAPRSPTTPPTKSSASTRSTSALGYAEWLDTKINLIDTPGYLDYFGEVVTGLHAADAAVVVLSGTGGVEVGTEKVWEVCDQLHLPRMLFVSLMDKEHADFERVFQDMKAHLTPKVVPVEIPIGDGPDFHGIINLFSGHCHFYKKGTKTASTRWCRSRRSTRQRFQEYNEQLIEAVAATDDDADRALPRRRGDPARGVHRRGEEGDAAGQIVPLFCGSATLTYGLRTLLKKMVELFPSPAERRRRRSRRRWSGRVFKTMSEPHVGDVTFFRLYAGELRNGDEVWNAEHEVAEKLNHLSIQQGKERIEVERLHAGDIGSVAKLRDTHTDDTFCRRDAPGAAPADPVPRAVATVGRGGEAARRGGQARRRAAQAARGRPDLPLRVQLRAGPDADPRHGRAPLRDHPRAGWSASSACTPS